MGERVNLNVRVKSENRERMIQRAIDVHGSKYGYLGREVDNAIEFYLSEGGGSNDSIELDEIRSLLQQGEIGGGPPPPSEPVKRERYAIDVLDERLSTADQKANTVIELLLANNPETINYGDLTTVLKKRYEDTSRPTIRKYAERVGNRGPFELVPDRGGKFDIWRNESYVDDPDPKTRIHIFVYEFAKLYPEGAPRERIDRAAERVGIDPATVDSAIDELKEQGEVIDRFDGWVTVS